MRCIVLRPPALVSITSPSRLYSGETGSASFVKRTVRMKLVDPPEDALAATVEAFREGCNLVSQRIEEGERLNRFALTRETYRTLRNAHGLPSQMAQSAVRTVVGAWRSWQSNGSRGKPPSFRRQVACYQHNRDWSLKEDGTVSFRLLDRRVRLAYTASPLGTERLQTARGNRGLGGARLFRRRSRWFLDVSVTLPTPPTYVPTTTVGVDAGINTLAVARAPGESPLVLPGGDVRRRRNDMHEMRRRLQGRGTRSARRALRAQRGREQRFVLDRCRVAARDIVRYANHHHAEIRLEDLTGIRQRVRPRGSDGRRRLHSWAFRTLQRCIADRAEAEGVPLVWVQPCYTSQACPACGHTTRANRDGPWFRCRSCGYQNRADVVAATNIAMKPVGTMAANARVAVSRPDEWVNDAWAKHSDQADTTLKPPTSVGGS